MVEPVETTPVLEPASVVEPVETTPVLEPASVVEPVETTPVLEPASVVELVETTPVLKRCIEPVEMTSTNGSPAKLLGILMPASLSCG